MRLNKPLWASRIDHRVRWIAQKIRRPAISVAGGYHSGNLGDMALAYSVKGQIAKRIQAPGTIGIQTIYNLPNWPRANKVVVGGGALICSQQIKNLITYTNDQPKNVGVIGCDILIEDLDEEDVDFLKNVSFLSFRSEFNLRAVNKYSLHNARLSPDIVFAQDESIFNVEKISCPKKTLAVNVTPGLGLDHSTTKTELKRQYANYIRWVRGVITEYLQAGYSVESIPFTHGDEKAAQENLSDLPIKHNSYTHAVRAVLARIERCDTFLCTRYHALIVGCLLEKKIIPFCYAKKTTHSARNTYTFLVTGSASSESPVDLQKPPLHWRLAFLQNFRHSWNGSLMISTKPSLAEP